MATQGCRRRRPGRRTRRRPRPRRPGPGPSLRRRGDDVVPRAGLARARPPRRGGVRPSGDRRQAGPAGGERRRPRSGRRAAGHRPRRRRPGRRQHGRRSGRAVRDAAGRRVGGHRRCGSVPGTARRRARPTTCCGSTTPAATAAHDGRLVLLYHVLWELTHVCFEHPGLLADRGRLRPSTACVTCSDEGRLAEVVTVPDATAAVGPHRRRRGGDRHHASSDRCTRATSCSSTPGSAIVLLEEAGDA